MDVVKSRLQADGVYLNKYKGVLDCISQSYQKDGLKVSPQQYFELWHKFVFLSPSKKNVLVFVFTQ